MQKKPNQSKIILPKALDRSVLVNHLADHLKTNHFKDYCPNGLQVEGNKAITRLAVAVTASYAAIEQAAKWGADALLVHHGIFWKNDDPSLVGPLKRRVQALLGADMSLLAYHLPLDAHPQHGNNASLGMHLGLKAIEPWSDDHMIWGAVLPKSITAVQLKLLLGAKLNREPLMVGALDKSIKRIAWCTGGAQGYLDRAIALGADAYISGEISEQTTHLAREQNVVFAAAGHHATESYGVQALGRHLGAKFKISVQFFDDPNPA
jgi:dinuclear metal center YbgI/SA1388 family protein